MLRSGSLDLRSLPRHGHRHIQRVAGRQKMLSLKIWRIPRGDREEFELKLARGMLQKPGIALMHVPVIISWTQAIDAAAVILRPVKR